MLGSTFLSIAYDIVITNDHAIQFDVHAGIVYLEVELKKSMYRVTRRSSGIGDDHCCLNS